MHSLPGKIYNVFVCHLTGFIIYIEFMENEKIASCNFYYSKTGIKPH